MEVTFRSYWRGKEPFPDPKTPDEVLKLAGFGDVAVTVGQDASHPEFRIGYGFEWDPDHCYEVTIRDWKAVDLMVHG